MEKRPTSKKSVGKGSTATKSKKQTSKKSVGKGSTATTSEKKAALVDNSIQLKGIAGPAVSPFIVVSLAKVRAEKQKFDREKKQKARSKSPMVPSQSNKKQRKFLLFPVIPRRMTAPSIKKGR